MKKDNEPLSSLTHLLGAALSVVGLVVLLVLAGKLGDPWRIVSFSIYGASLILLYVASGVYHLISMQSQKKMIFQKIDHAMIYLLIAGTYTPICLVAIRGGWGWSIFGVVWALALIGLILKFFGVGLRGWFSAVIYIVMGWIAIIAISPILKTFSIEAIGWLFAGGLFYTVGTIFFGLERFVNRHRWFGMHEIFHLFVLVGSFCHFWLMYRFVL